MNDDQLLRYSRHILLPQVDIAGQEAINAGSVLVVGAGGLGSPVCMYLAASGVGKLIVSDDDVVELSNLQRQIMHTQAAVGMTKVASAKAAIHALNKDVQVLALDKRLGEEELATLLVDVDVVVDCSDNLATRQRLNRICWQTSRPLVFGAAIRFEGQLSVFDFRDENSPCYECIFEHVDDEQLSCSENGIFSPIVGVVGCMQALEALKLLAGLTAATGRLGLFDGLKNQWRYMQVNKNTACKICCNKNNS